MNDYRRAILSADPGLSRFDPLDRIVFYDDFDHGLSGWTELMGNYTDPDDTFFQLPWARRQYRPPMLSNLTMPDMGTHGAMQGTYALKLATLPKAGHAAISAKRITWVTNSIYQLECFFTYKPEPSSWGLGDGLFRSFAVGFDVHDDDVRFRFCVRYLNALNGELQQKWQYLARGGIAPAQGGDPPDAFEDVPGGEQKLCYNETVTKINWHYLRLVVDLKEHAYVELQCNNRIFDMRGMSHEPEPMYPNLWCLINPTLWAEADSDVRCFF